MFILGLSPSPCPYLLYLKGMLCTLRIFLNLSKSPKGKKEQVKSSEKIFFPETETPTNKIRISLRTSTTTITTKNPYFLHNRNAECRRVVNVKVVLLVL